MDCGQEHPSWQSAARPPLWSSLLPAHHRVLGMVLLQGPRGARFFTSENSCIDMKTSTGVPRGTPPWSSLLPENRGVVVTEAGSYSRLVESCITKLNPEPRRPRWSSLLPIGVMWLPRRARISPSSSLLTSNLVFKAHRLLYHSDQGSRTFLGPVTRVTKKKKKKRLHPAAPPHPRLAIRPSSFAYLFINFRIYFYLFSWCELRMARSGAQEPSVGLVRQFSHYVYQ
jgi:hypothetical protein